MVESVADFIWEASCYEPPAKCSQALSLAFLLHHTQRAKWDSSPTEAGGDADLHQSLFFLCSCISSPPSLMTWKLPIQRAFFVTLLIGIHWIFSLIFDGFNHPLFYFIPSMPTCVFVFYSLHQLCVTVLIVCSHHQTNIGGNSLVWAAEAQHTDLPCGSPDFFLIDTTDSPPCSQWPSRSSEWQQDERPLVFHKLKSTFALCFFLLAALSASFFFSFWLLAWCMSQKCVPNQSTSSAVMTCKWVDYSIAAISGALFSLISGLKMAANQPPWMLQISHWWQVSVSHWVWSGLSQMCRSHINQNHEPGAWAAEAPEPLYFVSS